MKYLLLIFLTSLYGQKSLRVTYECRLKPNVENSNETLNNENVFFTLVNNGTLSEFKQVAAPDRVSFLKNVPTKQDTIVISKFVQNKGISIKDFIKNENRNSHFDFDLKEFRYVKCPFVATELNFKSNTKKIDNYTCFLVEGKNIFNDDDVKYWYTKEIPIFDGPTVSWLNIPGLILHIEYPLMEFYAIKIEFIDKELYIKDFPSKTKYIAENEYFKIKRNEIQKDKEYTEKLYRK